jgi:long-chain acyl-CoA synthetase
MSSLPQIIQRTVQCNPGKIATRFQGRARTWEEFQDRIARMANGLQAAGVKEGDRVACMALNSDRYYEFYFAVSWAGAVFLPINNRLAPAEVLFLLNDSASTGLFADDAYLSCIAKIRDQLETVAHFIYMGEEETPRAYLSYESLVDNYEPVSASLRRGDDMAGLFYTGGTTGRSKGVMLSHRNLSYNALQTHPMVQTRDDDVLMHAAPMFHAADWVTSITAATLSCTNVFVPTFEPEAVFRIVQEEQVSMALLVPTMINMLMHHPQLEHYDLSSLRRVLYGASPMPESLIRKALEILPAVDFHQAYGQTEAGPIMTILEPKFHTVSGPHAGKLKSAGRAVAGMVVAIMDENDRELPSGEVGEICGRGDNVMLGYWNLPDVTAQTLKNGWLHTGDGGRMDENGMLFVVDRVKDMIVSGGENVYSAETEQAIYTHPSVLECAVIGIPSDTWGEQVHAIVRLIEGGSLGEEELIQHCKQLIAGYKCPRSIQFRNEPLPLTGAGKILKKDLRAPFWQDLDRDVS